MKIWFPLFISIFGLSACQPIGPAPIEQIELIQPNTLTEFSNVAVVHQTLDTYWCKDSHQVKVQRNNSSNTIEVTFNEIAHKLSPSVTKNGKKYSNIRWVWWEKFDGKATLFNNSNAVLAEECIKQN